MTAPDRGATVITSAANPRIQAALALRDRRGRSQAGHLLVDGTREVLRALEAGLTVREAFVAIGPQAPEAAALLEQLVVVGVPLVDVAGAAWARLAYGQRGSEIVAVVEAPPTDLARVERLVSSGHDPLLVVVEDVEKPGNLGAIARSADGAGATGLLVAMHDQPGADPWNPNAVRASLGTVLTLPLAIAPTTAILAWLRAHGIRIVAARVQATTDYRQADLRGPVAIALGSEAGGLSPDWLVEDVVGVRLPMLGRADSLNISAAAAVLLYEARRQRDAAGPATTRR